MNNPAFTATVETLLGILGDLDEHGRPKRKLPCCPKCDEDELYVIHNLNRNVDFLMCYQCGWKIEGKR